MAPVEESKALADQAVAYPSKAKYYWPALIAAFLVLLIAFALRAYRIDGQSLWYDEGVSAAMAPRTLADITVRAAADIHPPLYYYLLHFWTQLTGSTEFAMRWLSLMPGVLLVAVVFALGRRLANRQVGIIAAIFAAFSPLLVYYAQETRMYAQMAFFAALSFLLLTHLIEALSMRRAGGRRHLWTVLVAYALVTMAMLYSHYFAFTVLAAQNLIMLAYFIFRRSQVGSQDAELDAPNPIGTPRAVALWVLIQIVVVGSYVPWLIATLPQLQSWPTISDPFDMATLLRRVFLAFSFGLSSDAAATANRELVFFVPLLGVALLPLAFYRRKYFNTTMLILFLIVPVLLMYLLSLQRPMYNPKFLLLAVPGYVLILALGLENLRQVGTRALSKLAVRVRRPAQLLWSALVVVVVLGAIAYPSGLSLSAYYSDPKYARDDYRGLVAYIAAQSSPGDAIVLNAPGQSEIFDYYYRGSQSVYPLPEQRPIDESQTETSLRTIVGQHARVWLVLWATEQSDPNSFVEHWLDANTFKTVNSWFGGIRLCAYTSESGVLTNDQDVSANFQDFLQLKAVHFDARVLEPGNAVNLTLTWEANNTIDQRYTVFVHIIDDQELLWGQMDGEPAGGSKPTDTWTKGMTISDRRGITILPATPPGEYMLELGMYRPDTGQRLTIFGPNGQPAGDRVLFGPVRVALPNVQPTPASLAIPPSANATFGNGIVLLGSTLHPVGHDDVGPIFSATDIAHLTLFWRADRAVSDIAAVRIAVRDQSGATVFQQERSVSAGHYPTSLWRIGDVVRDQYRLPLDHLAQGDYSVLLTMLDEQAATVAIKTSNPSPIGATLAIATMQVK